MPDRVARHDDDPTTTAGWPGPTPRQWLLAALRAAFEAGDLWFPGDTSSHAGQLDAALRLAYRHPWVVHVEPPDGRPADAAAGYLVRYVVGNAISDHRMVSVGDEGVTFQARRGPQTIGGEEFIIRFKQSFNHESAAHRGSPGSPVVLRRGSFRNLLA